MTVKLSEEREKEIIKLRESANKALLDLKRTTKPFEAVANKHWLKGRALVIQTYVNELEDLLRKELDS